MYSQPTSQESEYFNINNITDNGEDDKEEPPVPRACAAPSQNTADTVNSMLTDPLATGTQPKPCSTLDIHHFFKKHKGEHMVCVPCKNMKAWNPGQFPSDHMYMYSAVMSNTSLHFHIEKYYLEEFLAEAEHHAWVVQINSMRATFSIGYNYATLCEVLSHPNVSIHLLPLAPPPRPDDELPVFSGPRPPPLGAGLLPFSISALHCYLVRFIMADDQSLNVIECPEFCELILLLHQDLRNSDIPHHMKLHELIIDAWREYFIILKRNMAKAGFLSHLIVGQMKIPTHFSHSQPTG
ncbi:hypothetical protein EDD17DRAFT_1768156 [Pisolithus thermaeus]|nr:hypothetical protein EV401DRAFT_2081113 [Pisolithus croceorrhizus]KAI6144848.1 hypothetical protein EDD17DRAFT_1768156 [Pisolithus thermaeus]